VVNGTRQLSFMKVSLELSHIIPAFISLVKINRMATPRSKEGRKMSALFHSAMFQV
jgi:hypothetical protein